MSANVQFKRCEHCNSTFTAQPSGLQSLLCRPCAMDCDYACTQVLQFIKACQDNQQPLTTDDVEVIAEGAKVPAAFVQVMISTGRFGKSVLGPRQTTCQKCNADLKPGERSHCSQCMQALSQEIMSTKDVTSSQPAPPSSASMPPAARPSRFGLGRRDNS